MINLTADGSRALADIAARHDISKSAVEHLFSAVVSGQGYQAQFNHPDLGGMGQWSSGGMTMIGDMFNGNLKTKVADVCAELAELSRKADVLQPQPSATGSADRDDATSPIVRQQPTAGNWWPDSLGHASSTGAQNDLRYALFPSARRLAISLGGDVKIYDTGGHQITGFSQQQGSEQSVTFTSQHGLVSAADLREVAQPEPSSSVAPEPAATPAQAPMPHAAGHSSPSSEHDIFAKIERLADLHAKGILQDDEFHAKKRELLDRL